MMDYTNPRLPEKKLNKVEYSEIVHGFAHYRANLYAEISHSGYVHAVETRLLGRGSILKQHNEKYT